MQSNRPTTTERINKNYGEEVCFMPMASTQDRLCRKRSLAILYQYAMSIKKGMKA
jgi:hypothetical protein